MIRQSAFLEPRELPTETEIDRRCSDASIGWSGNNRQPSGLKLSLDFRPGQNHRIPRGLRALEQARSEARSRGCERGRWSPGHRLLSPAPHPWSSEPCFFSHLTLTKPSHSLSSAVTRTIRSSENGLGRTSHGTHILAPGDNPISSSLSSTILMPPHPQGRCLHRPTTSPSLAILLRRSRCRSASRGRPNAQTLGGHRNPGLGQAELKALLRLHHLRVQQVHGRTREEPATKVSTGRR